MAGFNYKWAALAVGLILLPAAILTYLSTRAFRDEQRSALAELQRFIPRLQQDLDQRLAILAARLAARPDPRELDLPQFAQLAVLDADGRFRYPPYLPLSLADRSPDFARALQRGVDLEFAARNPSGAQPAYAAALQEARSPRETVEALNALGRVGLAAGQLDVARQFHAQLERDPWIFDPDGAHPLTLSYLRLVGHLSPDQAAPLLEEWTGKVLAGDYPLFPGCRHLVDAFAARAGQLPFSAPRTSLLRDRLVRIGSLLDLIDIYYRLAAAGVVAPGTFSGTDAAGQSFLVLLQPGPEGTLVVCRFDLEALAADLLRSPAGLELQNRGFGAALFDLDDAARFDRRHRGGPLQVAPASQSIYRLNLGLYPRDEAFVLRNYRNRNLFIMAGIFLLAGTIAGGAYLLFRAELRAALEPDPARPRYLLTVHGIGYRLATDRAG